MDGEKVDPKQVLRITIRMGEGLVREGRLPLPELTDEQLDERFKEGIRRTLRDDKVDVALTFDHTNKLLHQAASYEVEHDAEASSLFYMLWVEHRANLIARAMMRRIDMPDDESIFIIRKFSVREKVTILWRLLRLQPFPPEALKVLTTIEEFRNSFVHFKWQSFPDFAAEDKAWQAINRVQEVVDALLAYEEEHVYYGQRERIAASAARIN